jgi:hypothetical protein
LRKILCNYNNLTELRIPDTLINLQVLNCWNNNLTELHIPNTLINLQGIKCCYNNITDLCIPDTLINLQSINCYDNNITELSVPSNVFINLDSIHCDRIIKLCIPDTYKFKDALLYITSMVQEIYISDEKIFRHYRFN